MKPRTLRRLELMAAAASLKMREDILRHNTTLGQIEYQQRVLAEYRARLRQSWRHGGTVAAGQAKSAEVFVTASLEAGARIELEAARAAALLDDALQALARNQQKRRGLATARAKAVAATVAETERRLEQAATWRPKHEKKDDTKDDRSA